MSGTLSENEILQLAGPCAVPLVNLADIRLDMLSTLLEPFVLVLEAGDSD